MGPKVPSKQSQTVLCLLVAALRDGDALRLLCGSGDVSAVRISRILLLYLFGDRIRLCVSVAFLYHMVALQLRHRGIRDAFGTDRGGWSR